MDLKDKQKTLRMISNGLYILTSRAGTKYGGATVTWLSQASFKPPLIMVAVRPDSSVFECLNKSGFMGVHMLGVQQEDIARKFLSTTVVQDSKMNGEPFTESNVSIPILQNAPAFLVCKVRQVIDGGGDHALVLAEVIEAEYRQDVKPLTVADSPWRYGG